MHRLFVPVAVLVTCAAQDAPGPYRVGNGVSAPIPINKPAPEYSEEARLAAVDGQVVVSLVVDAEGNPTDLKVTKPIGFGLDEKALEAVRSWKFTPGIKEGVAVPVRTQVELNFSTGDQRATLHVRRFGCKLPEGARRPSVLKSEHPPAPPPGEGASATLTFDVSEQGVPENLHIEDLSDPKWEPDVLAALREWRFQPTTVTGNPVAVPCRLNFAVGKMPSNVFRIGNGVSAPVPIFKPEPDYSEEARHARYKGTVVLKIVVDQNGFPRDFKVIRSLGLGLDEKAIEAVERWRFKAGMKEGQAVAVQATVEVNFRLLNKSPAWGLKSLSFMTPNGASRPRITKTKFPGTPEIANASVNVSMDIDGQGKPTNIHAEDASDEQSQKKILAAVREWRFEPAMQDGKPISVPCTMSFASGN